MGKKLFRLISYLKYLWKAQSNLYIHSPFVFDFFNSLLKEKAEDDVLTEISEFRRKLAKSTDEISVENFGSGEKRDKVKLSWLDANVAIKHKYGSLLYSLIRKYDVLNILELGTNIGISTLYLSKANPESRVITIEGSSTLAQKASEHFKTLNCNNINVIQAPFEETLENVLKSIQHVDMIFFDGNHNKEATLRYFEESLPYISDKSIFVFDDIYWSPDMADAWKEIKRSEAVKCTIDLYQLGICFFSTQTKEKQKFVLRY